MSDRSTRNRVDSILQDDGKAVTEPQRPDLKDSTRNRHRQRMLQRAPHNGVAQGLPGHRLDSDHTAYLEVSVTASAEREL